MKIHSDNFKETIKSLGRMQDVRITYTLNNKQLILDGENINSITPNYEASLLKSVMKGLDLDSNIDIPLGTEIKFEYGLLINGVYEYLDYGNYIVYKSEKQEDTLSYKITCYDKMLYSMKDYEHIDIPYPCTIKQYLIALCNKIGLQFKDSDFANANRQITNELFMTINEDGTYSSMGYTYRDVLDQVAETTGGCICLTLDDKVEVRYINKAINYETSKKSTNIEFESSVKEIVKIKELDGKSTQATRSGKNLFDASKISNSNIIVSDNGKTITMPIFTTGNGSESTSTTLKKFCPNLSIGDVVFLKFDRNLGITYNNFIYLTKTQEQWENGSSKTITQEMLDSVVILYGNRYNSGETGQCILTNFRIVKNADDEWEQYGASPSPDYPSEIENIEGNIEFKVANGLEETDENYQEQVVTFPLGEEKLMEGSYLADDGIHHKRGQVVFDGTENWYQYGSNIALEEWDNRLTPQHGSDKIQGYLCNIAVEGQPSDSLNNNTFATYNNITIDWIVFNINTSVEEWKLYLAEQYANGTPVVVEYELAEEEIEPYTEAQKTILTSIKTMKGTNIFEFPSDTIISYPINYDTIDEEYINDTNVNFGEKYRTN